MPMFVSGVSVELLDRKIAREYLKKNTIEEQYTREDIFNLDDKTLEEFKTALGVLDKFEFSRERLIRILTFLDAVQDGAVNVSPLGVVVVNGEAEGEHIFAMVDVGVVLFRFDTHSTPLANLIISTYESLKASPDKRVMRHDEGSSFLHEILSLTLHYESGGYSAEPEMVQEMLDNISQKMGQAVTREELGTWSEVQPPYKNIHTDFEGLL